MSEKFDVVIIGGGPAGLTAGIYAGRAGKKAAVFERETIGGQITFTDSIDNYPGTPGISGAEYAMKLKDQAEQFGTEVIMDEVLSVEKPSEEGGAFVIKATEDTYQASAVILATGLSSRHMGVPGEEKLIGKGISFCAVCDGMFFRGKDVAVYGGGNTALEDAIYLTQLANSVTIIHRRDRFRGEDTLVRQLKAKENVKFCMNSTVTGVAGDPLLQSVEITDNVTGEKKELKVNGLFVAIGKIPNGEAFRGLAEEDEKGYYLSGEDCLTGTPGLFVAGDGRDKAVNQLTTAVSDGAIAGTAACNYVDRLSGNEYV